MHNSKCFTFKEHRQGFDSYDLDFIHHLTFEKYESMLDSMNILHHDLSLIIINVVHSPSMVTDDEVFDIISNYLKKYIEKKNGRVLISAALNE